MHLLTIFFSIFLLWLKYIKTSPNTIPYYMDKVISDPIENSMESLNEHKKEVILSNCGCIVFCNLKIPKRYRMQLYLDKKTFGYNKQTWVNSNVESISEYAQNRNIPVYNMLSL